MVFLKKIAALFRKIEAQYPGAIFLGVVILLLASGDLFFKSTIQDWRHIWYNFYEAGGKWLFHFFGGSREIDIDTVYEPQTWILSIKHQVASVLAIYTLSSAKTRIRLIHAISWFGTIQVVGIIKYALAIRLSISNPDNLFAVSEQPMHFVLWLVPFTIGLRANKLKINFLWKQNFEHPLGRYPLLISRILAILIIITTFRILDLWITQTFFDEHRISLWQAGSQISNEFLRWPVIQGGKIVLNQFMYDVYIENHAITNGLTTVNLGAPCLGKGVLIIFSIIIILTNTTWQHKVVCIISGFFVLILFNIVRQSLLFSFVHDFGSASYNYQTWHDIYSGIIYLAIIGLWIICTSNKQQPEAADQ